MPSIAGIKAGNAYVVIGAIDDTGKMLTKIGRRLKNWGAGMRNLGMDMMFKGALALTPAAIGLNTFMKYEDLMLGVQARTGATAAEMEHLGQVARKMGRDIGVNATQIAQSMNELSTRGYTAKQIEEMARPIALLAKATGKGSEKDMEQAAQLMSLALRAFKLGTEESLPVANKLTIAANESNFALDDLRESLTHIGPLAHQMGMSLEETVAILAQMRDVEIDAASAGIGIRNILLNSANTKNAEEFNKGLAGFGIASMDFLDQAGNLKDGAQLIFEVFAKLKNLGTGQRASLLEGLFGKRAITPAIAAGTSAGRYKQLFDKMMAAPADEAEKIAHKMESGLGGAFRRLIGGVQDLSIAFGETLEPALTTIGFKIEKIINEIINWIDLNPLLTTSIVGVTVAVVGLGGALLIAGIAVGTIAPLFSMAGFVITTLGSAFTMAISGITAFVGLVWGLGSALIGAAVTGVSALITGVTMLIPIFTSIGWAIAAFATTLEMLFVGIGLSPFLALFGSLIGTGALIVSILASIILLSEHIGESLGSFWVSALNTISTLWKDIQTIISETLGMASQKIGEIGIAFKNTGRTVTQFFLLAFDLAKIGEYKAAWDIALSGLATGFDLLIFDVGAGFSDMVDKFVADFRIAFLEIGQMVREIAAFLSEFGKKAAELFIDIIDPMGLHNALGFGGGAGIKGKDQFKPERDRIRLDAEKKKQDRLEQRDRAKQAAEMDLAVEKDRAAAILKGKAGGLAEDVQQMLDNKGGPDNKPIDMGAHIKALEGLEKGSTEAAKAAFENTTDQQAQLNLLSGILNGIIALNQNLGVA